MKSLAYEIEHFLKYPPPGAILKSAELDCLKLAQSLPMAVIQIHRRIIDRTNILENVQSGNYADDALRIPVYNAVWINVGMKVYEDFFKKRWSGWK